MSTNSPVLLTGPQVNDTNLKGFEFLKPLTTTQALRLVQRHPNYFYEFVAWLVICLLLIGLCFYIDYETSKPYKKPKAKKEGGSKKPGFLSKVSLPSVSLPKVSLPSKLPFGKK